MPVLSASGYESSVSAAIVAMLAHQSAWQTITATATAAAAKAFIVEDDAGPDGTSVLGTTLSTTGAWAVVRMGPMRRPYRAFQTWGREGDVTLLLHVAAVSGDDAASVIRRARNLQGAVAAALEAQVGTTLADASKALASCWCESGDVILDDETRSTRGYATAPIIIHWSDLP